MPFVNAQSKGTSQALPQFVRVLSALLQPLLQRQKTQRHNVIKYFPKATASLYQRQVGKITSSESPLNPKILLSLYYIQKRINIYESYIRRSAPKVLNMPRLFSDIVTPEKSGRLLGQ